MDSYSERSGVLHAEDVPLPVIAESYGTPVYVYSAAHFSAQYQTLADALAPLSPLLCFAVKANSNLAVLRHFAGLGAGFDIVSGGELARVVAAGGDPQRTMFSGVGKSVEDIDYALRLGVGCFNVESAAELDRLAARAAIYGRPAPLSIRVNPDVDARTHPYISTGLKENKFGVPAAQALALYRQAARHPHLDVRGIDCHIGSQLHDHKPLLEALTSLLELVDQLATEGIAIEHLDIGGGLGVTYTDEPAFDVAAYGAALIDALAGRDLRLILEPGRFLVANGGVLLTRVEYLKAAPESEQHSFAVVDAGMNDLLRPALYQARHRIDPVVVDREAQPQSWDVVGPVCESADFLAKRCRLALREGSLLAVRSAGAYGMAQASNYNSRGRPAEVLVSGDRHRLIRRRETVRDQLALELALDEGASPAAGP